MNKGEFIHRVQDLTGIQERDRAERATGAVLGTLCGRITDDEVKDLEAQLPTGIDEMCRGNVLQALIGKVSGPSRLDRDAFVEKVKDRGHLHDAAEAETVTVAVFRTLKEQISEGEAGDVADQLPSKLKLMWLES